MAGSGAMVGMAGRSGGAAILRALTLPAAVAFPLAPGSAVGRGGRVGMGRSVGMGVRVGQGIGVGQGVGVGEGGGVAVGWAAALAASRRATRSQATTMLIKLRAISVALRPPLTFVGCLRAGGRSVVIFFMLLFAASA
jgi:hypothetical protein